MDAEKLLKMADFVETLPEETFDLSTWKRETDCGTVCCAIGWAAQKKLFRGLSFQFSETYGLEAAYSSGDKLECGFAAVTQLFNITLETVLKIFINSAYEKGEDSPRHVSQRIRELVELGEAEFCSLYP